MQKRSQVKADVFFRADPVPDLGLSDKAYLPLRVYVLKCSKSCYYVGISHKRNLLTRLAQQFDASSPHCSDYCKKNVPIGVLCVWPAASEAIEAAVFFGMLRALRLTDWSKLGGVSSESFNRKRKDSCAAAQIGCGFFCERGCVCFSGTVLFRGPCLSLVVRLLWRNSGCTLFGGRAVWDRAHFGRTFGRRGVPSHPIEF